MAKATVSDVSSRADRTCCGLETASGCKNTAIKETAYNIKE